MNKILLVSSVILVATVVFILQGRQVSSLRTEIVSLGGELREEEGTHPGAGRRPSKAAPPAKSRQDTAERREREPAVQPVPGGSEQRVELFPTAADRLVVEELAGKLGLDGDEWERLLTRQVVAERAASAALLNSAEDLLIGSGDYAEFMACVRTRLATDGGSELHERLGGEQVTEFSAFLTEQRGNLLQVLADREFDSWKEHLGLESEDAKQAAYDVIYRQWETRLESPLPERFSTAELDDRLRDERAGTLAAFEGIVTEETLELMRTGLTTAHDLLVRAHESVEDDDGD